MFGGLASIYKMLMGMVESVNIQGNAGCGYNFSIFNLIEIMKILFGGHISQRGITILKLLAFIYCGVLYVLAQQEWKKFLAVILLMICLPEFSYTYTLIFMIIPFLLLLKQREGKWQMICLICFIFILIPYALPVLESMDVEGARLPLNVSTIIINFSIIILAVVALVDSLNGFQIKKSEYIKMYIPRIIRTFFVEEHDIERASYIWNMLGSLLNAFQSVFFLMVLTRVLGIDEAGIFTIAYADANLFLNIGKFGMRYFQVSDYNDQFSFQQYVDSRKITILLMGIVSVVYVIITSNINSYSWHKSMVVLLMCIWKMADAFEDVYHGELQKNGRLDIAGKMLCIRVGSMTIVWMILLVLTKNLVIATAGATIYTFLCIVVMIYIVKDYFSNLQNVKKEEIDHRRYCKINELLRCTFPLFLSMFLSFYIGNVPKYAIDRQLSDELQACYGFIAMPVFVIGLINNFIFNPMVIQMSLLWNQKQTKVFAKKSLEQMIIVGVITLICVLGAYLLGIPVLSWIYHTDLRNYKKELLLMLVGGGFLGLSGLLQTLVTIQRGQKSLMYGYIIVTVLSILIADNVVRKYNIMGAVYIYIVMMSLLCGEFLFVFLKNIVKTKKVC